MNKPKSRSRSSGYASSSRLAGDKNTLAEIREHIIATFLRIGFDLRGVLPMLGILLVLLSGCGASRKAGADASRARTPDALIREMATNQVNAEWLDAKAKIDYDDGSIAIGVTAALRMRKDSVLWVAVKKLGFEVARALVTRDSVFIIDRINNEYQARDLTFFTREYNLPADFQALQAVVLGNPLFFMKGDFQLETTDDRQYHLSGHRGTQESHYWLLPERFQLTRMAFSDSGQRRRIEVRLQEYGQKPADQKFSYLRNLELESGETGKVSIAIHFSDVEFNVPKNIKFEIPEKYTRVD